MRIPGEMKQFVVDFVTLYGKKDYMKPDLKYMRFETAYSIHFGTEYGLIAVVVRKIIKFNVT